MKNFFKALWSALYPFLIYLVLELAVTFYLGFFVSFKMMLNNGLMVDINQAVTEGLRSSIAATGVLNLCVIPVFAVFMKNDDAKERLAGICRKKNTVGCVLLCMLAAVAAAVAGNMVLSHCGSVMDDAVFQQVNEAIGSASPVLMILVVVLLGPVAEELMFRGVMFRRLERGWGPAAAIIVSSLAFGAFHLNLPQGIYATFVGLLFCYAYYKTRDILVPVVMHVAANAASFVCEPLQAATAQVPIKYGNVAADFAIALIGLAVVAVTVIFLHGYSPKNAEKH